jgi:small subunit ribosomal protein S27Ae
MGRKHEGSKKWKMYEIKDGKIVRKNKVCPKCGNGVFMANHKDRWVCGKCFYVEYKNEKN